MKNVLKTLAEQKEAVEKEFGQLAAEVERIKIARAELQEQLNQVVTRQVELRGKNQQLEQLEKDFRDEPKEK